MRNALMRSMAVTVALVVAASAAGAAPKGGGNGNGGGKKGGGTQPPAPRTFTAPFAQAFDGGSCSPATPAEECDISFAADTSGVVRATARLEKVQPTVESWRGLAWGDVTAAYQLTQPVARVTATADIRVDAATVDALSPTNLLADPSDVEAFLNTSHDGCAACRTETAVTVVESRLGSASVADQTLRLTAEITNPSGPVPSGVIHLFSGLEAHAVIFDGPGSATSAVEGAVTAITVTPNL